MSETSRQAEYTTTEERIMRTKLPEWYGQDSPRVCLLQIQKAETANEEVEAKRKLLEEALLWDYEDYDETDLGA